MKALRDYFNGQVINLEPSEVITGGQYSISLNEEEGCLYLIPSVTKLVKGALKTELDMTRNPVKIGAN